MHDRRDSRQAFPSPWSLVGGRSCHPRNVANRRFDRPRVSNARGASLGSRMANGISVTSRKRFVECLLDP
jgi:hypothetical protein